jgi:hypothetical protein
MESSGEESRTALRSQEGQSPASQNPTLFSLPRAVNILPNRVVGTVGQHAGEPVEELALSHCGRFLASSGHDQPL